MNDLQLSSAMLSPPCADDLPIDNPRAMRYYLDMQAHDSEIERLVAESTRFLRFLANWWERNGSRILVRLLS